MKYDVFISHASEDKAQVALPLAHFLTGHGFRVWIDEFELTVGDSLRRAIDLGLSESEFGIVILSPNFFRKGWPNKELDGLIAREEGKDKVILPVWHNITKEDVLQFSPILAGKLGVSTTQGIDYIGQKIMLAVQRETQNKNLQLDSVPTRDQVSEELSRLRSEMLSANSRRELRHTLFKVEEFLSRYPMHPEAGILGENLQRALILEKKEHLDFRPQVKRGFSPISYFIRLVGLIGGGILLFNLIRWLWSLFR